MCEMCVANRSRAGLPGEPTKDNTLYNTYTLV